MNEITDLTVWPDPTHDAAGNMTLIPQAGRPGGSTGSIKRGRDSISKTSRVPFWPPFPPMSPPNIEQEATEGTEKTVTTPNSVSSFSSCSKICVRKTRFDVFVIQKSTEKTEECQNRPFQQTVNSLCNLGNPNSSTMITSPCPLCLCGEKSGLITHVSLALGRRPEMGRLCVLPSLPVPFGPK